MKERIRCNYMSRNIAIRRHIDRKRTPYLTALLAKTPNCKRHRFFVRYRVQNVLKVWCNLFDLLDLSFLWLRSINEMGCSEFLDKTFMLLCSRGNDSRESRETKEFKRFTSTMKS